MGGIELWVLSLALGVSVVVHVIQWIAFCDENKARHDAEVVSDSLRAELWAKFRADSERNLARLKK
jgi:hypothetical protein